MTNVRGRMKKAFRNEVSSSSSSTSSFSSDDSSDSDADLKPIKDYLSNRKEVAKQLFKSVKTEKIRMMLPQVLKKMEFRELEEWCASELAGMSKARILSILNGSTMSGSSDTSDSDDSGPSLEIISDTEEWLTDDETDVKQEPLSPNSKSKKNRMKRKTKAGKSDAEKVKGRKGKSRANQEIDITKVKKEKDKNESKPQEGESLLDLLELEMRARAIRALIRKEEDVIPDTEQKKNVNARIAKSTVGTTQISKNTPNTCENSQTSMETSETLVEKIGEDEDVVLLVKPTPTIELISSDSEAEELGGRVNKKLENERTSEKTSDENVESTKDASVSVKDVTNEPSSEVVENLNTRDNIINEPENVATSITSNESADKGKQTFRKLKRRPHLRTKSKSLSECTETSDVIPEDVIKEKEQTQILEEPVTQRKILEKCKEDESVKIKKITSSSEDRLGDYEEIIDLDDYPDDMYEMETDESTIIKDQPEKKIEVSKTDTVDDIKEDENSAETWATRYYQTDSVQNVIKESKIQSEIRKRLRERQRLSKLNNSPKDSPKSNDESNEINIKPTGSVDEYLALKGSVISTDSIQSESIDPKNSKVSEETFPASQEGIGLSIADTPTSSEKTSTDETNKSSTLSEVPKY